MGEKVESINVWCCRRRTGDASVSLKNKKGCHDRSPAGRPTVQDCVRLTRKKMLTRFHHASATVTTATRWHHWIGSHNCTAALQRQLSASRSLLCPGLDLTGVLLFGCER